MVSETCRVSNLVYFPVDDDVVIELVKRKIAEIESNGKSWIMSGFPRTKVQALSLQRMKIIPDRIMHCDYSRADCIKLRLQALGQDSNEEEVAIVNQKYDEYETKQKGVTETFGKFIYKLDGSKVIETGKYMARVLKLKFRDGAPLKMPGVAIIGPPGSGKTTQAQRLSETYGLVCVSPATLLR
jgi:adenylate kinase family enzyme